MFKRVLVAAVAAVGLTAPLAVALISAGPASAAPAAVFNSGTNCTDHYDSFSNHLCAQVIGSGMVVTAVNTTMNFTLGGSWHGRTEAVANWPYLIPGVGVFEEQEVEYSVDGGTSGVLRETIGMYLNMAPATTGTVKVYMVPDAGSVGYNGYVLFDIKP